MASINSKSGIMERKRSSPRNSPRETPKKDSKSKNAVKSAQYNRPERDDYREEDYEYIKKRDPPLEPQPERRKETISELDRIGLDGRFIIPNSELSHKETRERYKKLYFVNPLNLFKDRM